MASSPSSTDKSTGGISEAANQFINGKRLLLVNDYANAVTSLEEACHLFSKQYGETAVECAEPYLYYGKALLELSRIETGVLGNALEGVNPEDEEDEEDDEKEEDDQVENPDKVTGEEREQIIRQVEAAIDENSRDLDEKMCSKTNGDTTFSPEESKSHSESSKKDCNEPVEGCSKDSSDTLGDKKSDAQAGTSSETNGTTKDAKGVEASVGQAENSKHVGDETSKEETCNSDSNMDEECQDQEEDEGEESESTGEKSQDEELPLADEAGPSTSTGVSKEEKEEDDVSNLQLAWEMLELSKVIFKRLCETDASNELKVAEVLLKLGEVSIESENYQQAVEDLTECFSIQKKHLVAYDRALAETLYQLGLANSFSNQFELAIENFTNSMKVLEERTAVLKQSLEDQEKNSKNTAPGSTSAASETPKDNGTSGDQSNEGKSAKSGETDNEETKNQNGSSNDETPEDPLLSIKQEIEELEELIPEIRTKIEDTEDMMKNALNSLKEAMTEICDPTPAKIEEKPKTISNISHLVKRKRKPEDDSSSAETNNDLKKPRPSEEIEEAHFNGDTVVNGDSKPMETEESDKLKTKSPSVEMKTNVEQTVA